MERCRWGLLEADKPLISTHRLSWLEGLFMFWSQKRGWIPSDISFAPWA